MGDDDLDWIGAAEFIFQSAVRPKKSKQDPAARGSRKGVVAVVASALRRRETLAKIARVTRRRPEAVVRITGSARGKTHVQEHLAYITRNGQLVAEREDGERIDGVEAVRSIAAEWWAGRGEGRRKNARDTYNLVLSMPVGTDAGLVRDAAREFASQQFGGEHDYVFVLHTKETDPSKKKAEQPHVHLTVRTLGFQGQYLNPKKADLLAWREGFAAALRKRGVEAEATPRRARGKVLKGKRQAIVHMDKSQRSTVTRWKLEQAIKTVAKGESVEPSPWSRATTERQRKVRVAWGQIAGALDKQGEVALALQVQHFVQTMPSGGTERDVLVELARRALQRGPERGR